MRAILWARIADMKTLPLSEAKDKLSGLVEEAESTHEIITITRHGRPAAVLMAADDLESLHETLFWLSKQGVRDAIATAEREYAAGATTGGEDLRAEFGLPPQ
jgi:antitoxin YefM